jgi:hypothetical protein
MRWAGWWRGVEGVISSTFQATHYHPEANDEADWAGVDLLPTLGESKPVRRADPVRKTDR